MLFCICPDITTSELYKRLGGTQSWVETFHSSTAPLLMQEASAQRSWRLHTAATGSPGLMVGHSLRGTPRWPLLPGKQKPMSLPLFFEELPFGCQGNVLHPPPPAPSLFLHTLGNISKILKWQSIGSLRKGLGLLSFLWKVHCFSTECPGSTWCSQHC